MINVPKVGMRLKIFKGEHYIHIDKSTITKIDNDKIFYKPLDKNIKEDWFTVFYFNNGDIIEDKKITLKELLE